MRKIFINGKFYTFDPVKPCVEAVVVEEGRFIDMGTKEEITSYWGSYETEIVDLGGKTVTPGLIDSHLHLSSIAINLLNLDVTGVTSKTSMLQIIKDKAANLSPGEWLVGRGWDENLFIDGGIPTINELDSVSPHNPLYIPRVCGHAALVNRKALEVCHYHRDMIMPQGGSIELDETLKQPTGLILESAADIFTAHIPEYSYDDLKGALRQAIKLAIRQGLTSVHTNDTNNLGGLHSTYRMFDELLNQEKLGLRCNLLIDYDYLDDLKESSMYAGYGNETLTIGAVKLFADGAFGRRTALLSEPYADDPSNVGEAMHTNDELYDLVRKVRNLSMPIAVHTIGDKALENILDILDQFPVVAYRDRLIHVQVLREDLINRLAVPSRIADLQPRFVVGDFPWVAERLGPKRMNLAYAWKTLLNSNVICAGGSDSPVEPMDPLLGIHAAVTRRAPGDRHKGWNSEEKLSMYDAFKLFTKMGAYPTNEETLKGTISRGKLADMTVYSTNPFEIDDPDELLETTIEMTIIGGDIHYQKSLHQTN
ncbi:amidohydrolase [Ornithinibacillus massiliensis]|uniref:Amidohydrolase n=1 Tax=Ornithinibacillus massiliensis TaxID=1944633 RepID=A0ABS5MHY8_9BACI|nr:amidohydrolase [Ornithinibacillus massiliensis]MBS3681954.1 amidohydrolase [Ornithinibacillus massiliensis]